MNARFGRYDVVEDDGAVVFTKKSWEVTLRGVCVVATLAIGVFAIATDGDRVRLLSLPAFVFPIAGLFRAARIAAFGAFTFVRRRIEIRAGAGGYRETAGKVVVIDRRELAASDVRDLRTLYVMNANQPPVANLYLVAGTEAFKVDSGNGADAMDALGRRLADALDVPFVKSQRTEPVSPRSAMLAVVALFVETALMLLSPFGFVHFEVVERGLDRGGVSTLLAAGALVAWVLAIDAVFPVLVGLALRPAEHARARRMFEE